MGWRWGGAGEWVECYSLGPGFISLLVAAEMSFSWNIEWVTSGGIYQSPQKVLEVLEVKARHKRVSTSFISIIKLKDRKSERATDGQKQREGRPACSIISSQNDPPASQSNGL